MQQNPKIKKLLIRVVNNQIRYNNPAETKKTLDRLVSEGYSQQKAKELIASVVMAHIYSIMQTETAFDEALYVRQLQELPKLPVDQDE
ncbi:MAG: hypothetical protein U5R06_18000 [candidate division KSB1 bacterium]|nr:hypothetical protein [candidate division KSB1 bacterium]